MVIRRARLAVVVFSPTSRRGFTIFILVQLACHIETNVRQASEFSTTIVVALETAKTGFGVASVEWQFWGIHSEKPLPGNIADGLAACRRVRIYLNTAVFFIRSQCLIRRAHSDIRRA